MLRLLPLGISVFLCIRLGTACSVPQWDPAQAANASVPQLLDSNHFRKALELLSAQADPSPQHQYLLSRAQLGLNQLDAALASAVRAVSAEPGKAAYHLQVAAVAGRLAEHAPMFKQISLAKRVRKELDQSIALDPKSPDAMYGLMLFDDMAPSFLGGDKAQAQKRAEELTAIDPSRGYLAQAALARNRHDVTAEQSFLNKAVAAGPESYEARLALATFQFKQGADHTDQADEAVCAALYLDPTRGEAWQLLAEAAGTVGCLPEVEGLLFAQARFNAYDLSAAYAGALGMIESGRNLDTARALLERYLQKPPDGNAPTAGMARFRLASIAEKEGRVDQAVNELRAAIDEDPTLDEAKKALKRLERTARP